MATESTTPSVSVVIPYGGRRRHLALALWSLAGQRGAGRPLQVVVVVCPSAEGRPRSARALAGRLALEWVRFDRPGFAPAGARNRGLGAADGDIVISLDDDMVAPPSLVTAHVRLHERGPVAAFGLRRFIALPAACTPGPDIYRRLAALPDVRRSASNRPGSRRDWRAAQAPAIAAHPHPYHCFHGCNVSYDRLQALEVGGWCEEFDGAWGYEDVEFGARLHAAGAPVVWARDALCLHLEGDAGEAARRRVQRDRNLRLVTARVPGYALFRHRERAGERGRALGGHR